MMHFCRESQFYIEVVQKMNGVGGGVGVGILFLHEKTPFTITILFL